MGKDHKTYQEEGKQKDGTSSKKQQKEKLVACCVHPSVSTFQLVISIQSALPLKSSHGMLRRVERSSLISILCKVSVMKRFTANHSRDA